VKGVAGLVVWRWCRYVSKFVGKHRQIRGTDPQQMPPSISLYRKMPVNKTREVSVVHRDHSRLSYLMDVQLVFSLHPLVDANKLGRELNKNLMPVGIAPSSLKDGGETIISQFQLCQILTMRWSVGWT